MADQLKNLLIGLFVTAAIGIIIFVLMFLHPNIGDEGKKVHVHFTDIDKITIGTRVTYGGRPIGEVVGIQEIEHARSGPVDANGRIYLYDLELSIDSGVNVYNTDKISSHTSGLLGEKNIEITPYSPQKGQKILQIDTMPIFAAETESIEDTLKGINVIAEKFQGALDAVTDVINRVRDELIVEKIAKAIDNFDLVIDDVHKSWSNVNHAIHDIDLAAIQFASTAESARNTLSYIDAAIVSAHQVINQVARGDGTLGKFISNEDSYLRFTSILNKAETTMDDINHYGLLFHSDKGWQRLRSRRLNLLQKLQTPQEFRNYFNDEIDQISTSLSRVYMVLNEVSEDPNCGCLLDNREYNKVFSELMRRVGMLEEEIRMYNGQVVEMQSHTTEL